MIGSAQHEALRMFPGEEKSTQNSIDHPPHYTWMPNDIEVIDITELLNFCRGNAVKYLLRAGRKTDELEDLKKARWYLDREIRRMENPCS